MSLHAYTGHNLLHSALSTHPASIAYCVVLYYSTIC